MVDQAHCIFRDSSPKPGESAMIEEKDCQKKVPGIF